MKGLLFKPRKIKAIAESPLDREWQTRRIIKFKPLPNIMDSDWHAPFKSNYGNGWIFTARFGLATRQQRVKPRYLVGETVYIKEAWLDYVLGCPDGLSYKLDHLDPKGDGPANPMKWKSPLFMPAWAARLFCLITNVSAEHLSLPLSLEDLQAEGGEEALKLLEKINGLWVWKYSFIKVDKTSGSILLREWR